MTVGVTHCRQALIGFLGFINHCLRAINLSLKENAIFGTKATA